MVSENRNAETAAVLENYDIGSVTSIEPCGSGHINETFIVSVVQKSGGTKRYILQRLNGFVFHEPRQVMENIEGITGHLRRRIRENDGGDLREVLTLVLTRQQQTYCMQDDVLWRMYDFVENTVSVDSAATPDMFYHAGRAFGDFFRLLSDYPVDCLHETIPNFHNTPDRLRLLREAISEDPYDRAAGVAAEIDFVLRRKTDAYLLYDQMKQGRIPLRVTHNDTKLNNVLLDEKTGRGVCVIDLDTVMPGLSAYDFGDAIRFGASTCAEDETDLSKCGLSLDMYTAYARGFLEGAKDSVTPAEIAALPLGAKVMTFECGMRFLTDHLNGDVYFKIQRPGHNLHRCRTQFGLMADMERNWDAMTGIIEELSGVNAQ